MESSFNIFMCWGYGDPFPHLAALFPWMISWEEFVFLLQRGCSCCVWLTRLPTPVATCRPTASGTEQRGWPRWATPPSPGWEHQPPAQHLCLGGMSRVLEFPKSLEHQLEIPFSYQRPVRSIRAGRFFSLLTTQVCSHPQYRIGA